MDQFQGYERFYLEIEARIENAVHQNNPRPWDENNITHNILASLRQLGPEIKINRKKREAVNIHWDFFKLNGRAEQQYGDVAFIIRMQQKDGQYTDGLGVIEAKKINSTKDEYTELLGARKDQLQRQVARLPYALIALYDHENISGFQANLPYLNEVYPWGVHWPHPLLEQTKALCVPGNVVLAANRRNRTLHPLGVPLSFQIAWRFLRGFDLHYEQENFPLLHRFAQTNGGFQFIVIASVTKGEIQPELPLQPSDLEGYERLNDFDQNE